MGLIKALAGAAGGVLADQWKEFFHCESMEADVLVVKGQKSRDRRSSNTRGSDNVISSGSVITISDGQAMAIVDQGKVVEFCAVPGEFYFDASTEPSIFQGYLGGGIRDTFAEMGKRFAFGGQAGKDQRLYYFNLKEIVGNKYGTPNPVPFRIVDQNIGLDVDISIRCNGEYSYRMTDPMLFYTNVCGNVEYEYRRSEIDSMLKTELLTALQPAFAKISAMGIRYSALPGHTTELAEALNEVLSQKWAKLRGIEIASMGINSITAAPEDEKMIKELQRTAVMRNPGMAGATMISAQADALKMAASNPNGAMMGVMGMNAVTAAAPNAAAFYDMAQHQTGQSEVANEWKCSCGAVNKGKFCMECGQKRPKQQTWQCRCGAVNSGKFCNECGQKRPADESWICDCGAENQGKFCNECGSIRPEGR
jgi:membrane protease subunit (stomatin/prohibitin family)